MRMVAMCVMISLYADRSGRRNGLGALRWQIFEGVDNHASSSCKLLIRISPLVETPMSDSTIHTSKSTNSGLGSGESGGGGSSPSPNRLKILPRGDACWSCRRRKLVRKHLGSPHTGLSSFLDSQRCDGNRPICGPCRRYQRPQECVFDEKPLSEVQLLERRVSELEFLLQAALHQQEGERGYELALSGPSPTSPSRVNSASSLGLSSRSGEFPRPDIALFPLSTEGVVSEASLTPELINIL